MILDGKLLSSEILEGLKKRAPAKAMLAVILVGQDPASIHFLRQKERACAKLGINFLLKRYPATLSRNRLKKEIEALVQKPRITAIIIQLPLPKRLGNPAEFLNQIPREKDADVLGSAAFGAFATGDETILPPVVGAIKTICEKRNISLKGKNAVIVGRGPLVGKPAAIWFINRGATVSVLNSKTKNLQKFTKSADILVTGVGKPGFIRGKMVKRGAAVFDAGYATKNGKPRINRKTIIRGKPAGDVDFKSVSPKASLITPVPGGIGPLTVVMLLKNVIALAELQKK